MVTFDGVIRRLNIDAKSFTPDDYRKPGECVTLKKLTLNGKTLNDETLPLLDGLEQLEDVSTNESQLSDEPYKQLTIHTTDISAADIERLASTPPKVKIDNKPLTDEEREATLVK